LIQDRHAAENDQQAAPVGRTILLYDGVCGLCNRFVRFVLRRDRMAAFYFAPLQGKFSQAILGRATVDLSSLDTVVLVRNADTPAESLLFRSDAAIEVFILLGGGWAFWARWLRRLPRGIRDAGYRLVARTRYRIFGKYDACPLPAPEDRARFLPPD
jgi:predicted DCC family thiol-disulfide oxidoreductase YuxK